MTNQGDPRQIITPDAFRVAPALLGLPLAEPWRRAAAMLVDVALIGVLVGLKAISGTLFGFLLAWVLFRISSPAAPGALRGAARGFARIAAIVALVVSTASFASCVLQGPLGDGAPDAPVAPEAPRALDTPGAPDAPGAREGDAVGARALGPLSLPELGRGVADVAVLRSASAADEARAPAERLARALDRAGATPSEIERVLQEILASGAERPWSDTVVADVVAEVRGLAAERAAGADSVALRYAEAVLAGDTARARALREGLAEELAGERIEALREQSRRLREQRDRALAEAEEGPGMFGFLRGLADDFGLGFGWAGLYFTIFLTLWKGQTPGKRLLGLRVVRLSGGPIGWWPAFERFGGYAASAATGLLGFFQILWDANRQGVHDKIVSTVVVRDSSSAHRAIVRAARGRGPGSGPSAPSSRPGSGPDARPGTPSVGR